jgi:hypothetical protein
MHVLPCIQFLCQSKTDKITNHIIGGRLVIKTQHRHRKAAQLIMMEDLVLDFPAVLHPWTYYFYDMYVVGYVSPFRSAPSVMVTAFWRNSIGLFSHRPEHRVRAEESMDRTWVFLFSFGLHSMLV